MFDLNFRETFATLASERRIEDPWGLGASFSVRRSDHPGWVNWLKTAPLGENDGLMARVKAKAQARFLKSAMTKGKRGGDGSAQSFQELSMEILGEMVDAGEVTVEDLNRLNGPRGVTNAMKPGIAMHLLQAWEGVRDEVTQGALEPTLENKLRLLGWEGVLVLYEDARAPEFLAIESMAEGAPVCTDGATVTTFECGPCDERGNLWVVPEGAKYGGMPVGDAFATLIMEGANEQAAYLNEIQGGAEALFGDTPDGDVATLGA